MRGRFASHVALALISVAAFARVVAACGSDDDSSASESPDASLGANIDAGPLPLSADDDAIDFGSVPCGQPIDPYDITFTNDGGATILYDAGLTPAGPFSLQAPTSGILDVGAAATVTVLAPTLAADAGAAMYSATLVISDAYGHVPLTFPVTLQTSGGTIVAPSVDTGSASSGTAHVSNTGNAPVLVAALSPSANIVATWDGSPMPYLLQPNDTFDVQLSIYGSGAAQADLTLVVTGGTCGASAGTLSVKGTGSGAAPPDGSAPITTITGDAGTGANDASSASDAASANDASLDAASDAADGS